MARRLHPVERAGCRSRLRAGGGDARRPPLPPLKGGLNHLAFRLPLRAAVDALRAWCRKKKLPMLSDDRYPFATGGTDDDALFLEDPDRIKVEFVAG